eukprot:scaffold20987_cov31-Tisochrysis_lutea.AAC.1
MRAAEAWRGLWAVGGYHNRRDTQGRGRNGEGPSALASCVAAGGLAPRAKPCLTSFCWSPLITPEGMPWRVHARRP